MVVAPTMVVALINGVVCVPAEMEEWMSVFHEADID
jgi:hypothetical protein